jgi:hypothetical protein
MAGFDKEMQILRVFITHTLGKINGWLMRRLLYDPQVAKGVWVYFALKITELLDTVSILPHFLKYFLFKWI